MKSNILRHSLKSVYFVVTAVVILTVGAWGNSSASKTEGKLKNTDYCKKYKEFEEQVPTVSAGEQRKLLEQVLKTEDFPGNPKSLKQDYEFIIDGYEKKENNTYDINQQEKYKQASERMQRHAIDNCELLVSNSGTGS